uniref:Uncharacterized protein n=1 Tax=Panagrolaimus superbus TaxID=310955 RepID=A0A914YX24_9BILA
MAARSTTRIDTNRLIKSESNEFENAKTVVSSKSLTSTTSTFWDPLMAHLNEFIHDQRHFTARWLLTIEKQLQIKSEQLALGITAILSIYLLLGSSNQMLANSILVTIPLLMTYLYPAERPSTNNLLLYWALYSIVTLFDNGFKTTFSGWFFFKVSGAASLFLRPFEYGPKIVEFIQKRAF